MNEYKYILNGMDYAINEQPSRHEIPRGRVTHQDETAQVDRPAVNPVRAVLTALINLVTRQQST